MGERERLITLNLVGIIAGIIILLTIFSPWIGVVYIAGLTTYSREFSSLDFFTGSFSLYLTGLLGIPPPPQIVGVITSLLARVPVYTSLALVTVVLLIVSAVLTFFHGFIGGGLGLIGLLIYTVLGSDLYTGYNVIMPGNAFTVTTGAGFIVSWIAVALALISQFFRLKAPQLVSITVWKIDKRVQIKRGDYTDYFKSTYPVRCPKCGAENSLSANFCKKCGAPLTSTPDTLPKPS
jgi:hypothetical protein